MSGQRRGSRPRTGHDRPPLGQHFLRSGALAADLVAHTAIGSGDLVVDLGAGEGALTRPLVRNGARVLAVEIDPGLAAYLRREFAAEPHVEVVEADLLDVALPREPYRVVGNIPFDHTAQAVRRLTGAPVPPLDAYLVLQREAAGRFAGLPWAPETLRSLLLKPWWHVEVVRHLRPTDFAPPPSVDCALLWLARRPRPLVADGEADAYRDFIAHAFGRRGSTLREALRPLFTRAQTHRLAADLRFDLAARVSDLDFARWLALFRAFTLLGTPPARARVRGAIRRLPR